MQQTWFVLCWYEATQRYRLKMNKIYSKTSGTEETYTNNYKRKRKRKRKRNGKRKRKQKRKRLKKNKEKRKKKDNKRKKEKKGKIKKRTFVRTEALTFLWLPAHWFATGKLPMRLMIKKYESIESLLHIRTTFKGLFLVDASTRLLFKSQLKRA